MVASSDILIASEKASLGLPEVDVGLLGGCRHAMRLFSHSRLRRMALTGYRVSGPELYRLGVVEACTTPEELDAGGSGNCHGHRIEEPGVHPHGQAHAERDRGPEPARWIPLRTGHDRESSARPKTPRKRNSLSRKSARPSSRGAEPRNSLSSHRRRAPGAVGDSMVALKIWRPPCPATTLPRPAICCERLQRVLRAAHLSQRGALPRRARRVAPRRQSVAAAAADRGAQGHGAQGRPVEHVPAASLQAARAASPTSTTRRCAR